METDKIGQFNTNKFNFPECNMIGAQSSFFNTVKKKLIVPFINVSFYPMTSPANR